MRPEAPESITPEALDWGARRQLRSLNKESADQVARHLAYAGELMQIDPEEAYVHAREAYRMAARIDIVREALGLTAYATERYAEALRELRTYRRMSDDYRHVPLEADAERGLGRPEKALRFIEGIPLRRLNGRSQVELALVTSGARAETGDSAGGLSVLEKILVENLPEQLAARVQLIKADRLEELGRQEEAEELREKWQSVYADTGEDVMVDLDDVLDDLPREPTEEPARDSEELATEAEKPDKEAKEAKETVQSTDEDAGTESKADQREGVETEPAAQADEEPEFDAEAEGGTVTEGDSDAESHAESEGGTVTEGDSEADSDTVTESDNEADSDAVTESHTDDLDDLEAELSEGFADEED